MLNEEYAGLLRKLIVPERSPTNVTDGTRVVIRSNNGQLHENQAFITVLMSFDNVILNGWYPAASCKRIKTPTISNGGIPSLLSQKLAEPLT